VWCGTEVAAVGTAGAIDPVVDIRTDDPNIHPEATHARTAAPTMPTARASIDATLELVVPRSSGSCALFALMASSDSGGSAERLRHSLLNRP
jgi:hypothetical protein